MMFVILGEMLYCWKECWRVDILLGLVFFIVGVVFVLDVRVVFCLGKVFRVGCKVVEE